MTILTINPAGSDDSDYRNQIQKNVSLRTLRSMLSILIHQEFAENLCRPHSDRARRNLLDLSDRRTKDIAFVATALNV